MSQDPVFWEVGESEEGLIAIYSPQSQNSYNYALDNPIKNKDPLGRYVRDISNGYEGITGLTLIMSENHGGIVRAHANIWLNRNTINSYENADVIKSIIFEEQSHGLEDIVTDRTFGKTVGLGQITINDNRSDLGYNSYTRSELLKDFVNIKEISNRISSITDQLNELGIDKKDKNFIAYLATAYNSQAKLGKISNYGRRVQSYYNDVKKGKKILPSSKSDDAKQKGTKKK